MKFFELICDYTRQDKTIPIGCFIFTQSIDLITYLLKTTNRKIATLRFILAVTSSWKGSKDNDLSMKQNNIKINSTGHHNKNVDIQISAHDTFLE